MRAKTWFCTALVLAALLGHPRATSAEGAGERRGELGVQVGLRLLDGDIVPDDRDGVEVSWGIEGAWALNERWAVFGDANTSTHDSIELCEGAEFCSALTPEVTIKVVTIGLERRFRPGSKGGQWLLGLGTGMMDLEWNGIQVHHGILSLNAGGRMPLGPGALRVTLRVETGFSGRTDNQLEGSFEGIRVTNVVVVAGWGFGFGGRR